MFFFLRGLDGRRDVEERAREINAWPGRLLNMHRLKAVPPRTGIRIEAGGPGMDVFVDHSSGTWSGLCIPKQPLRARALSFLQHGINRTPRQNLDCNGSERRTGRDCVRHGHHSKTHYVG